MIDATWISQHVTIFQTMDALGVYDGGEETTRQMLCPVHVDTKPSARVYVEENRVHCFTCGRGWDVLGLVMAVKKLAYPQAGEWVIETFGLSSHANLTAQLRSTLSLPVGTMQPFFQHVEQTLRGAKARLTCDRYTKLALAIDVVSAQYRESPDRERARRDLGRILKALQQHGVQSRS